jgi:hypothetical protein
MPGDIAIPLVEREAPPFRKVSLDRYTPPTGKTVGRIIMGQEFDAFLGSKYKAYLSIGADKGLKPGDYLRATRTYSYSYRDFEAGLSLKASEFEDTQVHPQKLPIGEVSSLPRRTLGDMIVLQVRPKSATVMVLTALEDVHVGDGVELMDTSEAPVLPPIRPSYSNAPLPDANNPAATMPPKITCSASPTSLRAGENSTISCNAVSPDNRPVNITYVANGGKLSSNRNQATLDTADTGPGPISVRATAFDDRQLSASTVVTVNVEAPAATAPAIPTAQKLMELEFKPNGTYVDNRSKAVLDDVALKMQQDPNLTAVLSGSADAGDGLVEGGLIERDQNIAVGLQPLANAEAQLARHQRLRRRRTQIIAVGFEALAHFNDVAMAFGGEQRHSGALALQQRVGRNRGAMNQALGRGQHVRARNVQPQRQFFQPRHDADRLVGRRGRRFCKHGAPGLVRGHQVGIGSADVNSDCEHR